MARRNKNKSLFWYGVGANFKKLAGGLLIMLGLFMLLVHWLLTLIFIIVGVILIAKGASQRFDYQRQSGSIIHQGDWR